MDDGVKIINLINQADRLATKRDSKRYSQLFAETGKIVGIEGSATGPSEIAKMVVATWEKEARQTFHLTTNVEITNLTTDHATVLSTLLLVSGHQIISIDEIEHQLVKQTDTWLFAQRAIKD